MERISSSGERRKSFTGLDLGSFSSSKAPSFKSNLLESLKLDSVSERPFGLHSQGQQSMVPSDSTALNANNQSITMKPQPSKVKRSNTSEKKILSRETLKPLSVPGAPNQALDTKTKGRQQPLSAQQSMAAIPPLAAAQTGLSSQLTTSFQNSASSSQIFPASAGAASKSKQTADGTMPQQQTLQRVPGSNSIDESKRKAKSDKSAPILKTSIQKQVGLFAHLPPHEREAALSSTTKNRESIHPAILRLGLLYANNEIIGSNPRCIAMLHAFKQVIKDYQTPGNTVLSRHLDAYLRPLINYLVQFRPLSVSMGNAIRQLKCEIANIPPDTAESEAKEYLCDFIDTFIKHRIEFSQALIAQHACTKIKEGDVILTYAHSTTVIHVLLEAATKKKIAFRVIVIDSRPLWEGRKAVKKLMDAGVHCSYASINSIGVVIKESELKATKIFLGAHCLFSNGSLLSRSGTAVVAMIGHESRIPVIVCSETYKFSDRVQLDSIVFNEIADPQDLVYTGTKSDFLADWRDIPSLKLLNVMYDLTPSKFISIVICEVGMIPCTSVPVVIREYRSFSS